MRSGASVLAAGAAWGLFCAMVGDAPLATTLAQMAMPWVWLAAMVGRFRSCGAKQAAVTGLIVLLAANVTYFLVRVVGRLIMTGQIDVSDVRFVVLWSVIGAAVGPAGAVVGWSTQFERSRVVGVALLGAASVAEPLAWWWHVDRAGARTAYLMVAMVGMAILGTTLVGGKPRVVRTLLLAAVMVYPTAVGIEAVLIATEQVSRPFRLT